MEGSMRNARYWKLVLVAAGLGTGVYAAPDAEGQLRLEAIGKNGRADYVCTLQGEGNTYTVKVSYDPASKTMSAEVAHPIVFTKGRSYTYTGGYIAVEERNEGQPTQTTYSMGSPGTRFNFNLTYTDGVTLPYFAFGLGLKSYACQ